MQDRMPKQVKANPITGMNDGRGKAHPNGQATRAVSTSQGRMPKQVSGRAESGMPLPVPMTDDVHDGQTDTNRRMPKQTGGAAQRDPWRK